MSQLDATIVNVALPRIATDLDASVAGLQWVLTGYLLTLASLILVGGALGDKLGRRRVFLIGTAWFTGASLLCGLSVNVPMLVGARLLQGVGAALLTPQSLALIQAVFAESDRARAVGAWSGLGGLAGAIGPFVGGALVDGPGWRWAFLLNLPVAVAIVLCSRALPESRDESGTAPIDVVGALLAVGTLVGLTFALTGYGRAGWGAPTVAGPAVAAVALAVAFVVHERRARHPLVPTELFRSRPFTVLNVATFTLYGALGVTFFLVVYQLEVSAGWSGTRAGTALLPATLLMLAGSAKSGALAQRIGPVPQLVVGPLLAGGGLLLLSRVGPDASWLRDVLPGSIVFGLGLVAFVAPLTATVMGSAAPEHVSIASAVNNAVARTGSLAAVAFVPVAAGLTDAIGPAAVSAAYARAIRTSAGFAFASALFVAVALRRRPATRGSSRSIHCAIDGAPLQPDPRACPSASSRAPAA